MTVWDRPTSRLSWPGPAMLPLSLYVHVPFCRHACWYCGFNRISYGLQDADPEVQRAVNRVVPVEQLRRVAGWLREAAFASVSVDLICGLPLQTPERFDRSLSLVEELRPDRVSFFSFADLPVHPSLQPEPPRPAGLERRRLIQQVMCRFETSFDATRYSREWHDLEALAADGLVELVRSGSEARLRVTPPGPWLLRSVVAVFDPAQRQCASGSRLL